jgi:hypothetical protein
MKRILATAAALWLAAAASAFGQAAPANLPFHTVYGRIGAVPGDSGPGQAITFNQLANQMFATTPTLQILKFRSASGGITTLTTNIHAGSPIVNLPSFKGEIVASVTPQYIGFKCDGTPEAGIIQATLANLPAAGGVIWLPQGSFCNDSSPVTINKPNVKIMGPVRATGNGGVSNQNVSRLNYTGTAARYIDARSIVGLGLINVHLTYSSASFAGSLVDVSSNNIGVTVGAFATIEGSFLGTDTNRTGTATLLNMGQTVDAKVDGAFFYHGAPAILGGVTAGQNTVATIRKSWFSLGDGVAISGCGESWTLEENAFEATPGGLGVAFQTISTLPCKAMVWKNNWFGDVSVGGGTWIDVWANGFTFIGNRIAGDTGNLTNGISLNASKGIFIGGNDFDFLNIAINCTTAVDGGSITGNRMGGSGGGTITTKIANPSNCTNITTEGNSPSISLVAAGQIRIGQSGADPAPKTLSGDATLASTGAVTFATVNSNTGTFGDGTHVGQFTVNAKGQVTAASSVVITGAAPTGAAGGDLAGTYPNPTINNAPVIAKLLTAFASGAGAVSATDSILSAFQKIDGNVALKAPLASPALTGVPTAPTASPGTNTTQLATTAYADAIAALKANLASPTFTGTPAAPTAAVDTNTTQIATTAMVLAQAASATPLMDGSAAVGTSTRFARGDHVHPTDTSRAPLASPTFTGTPAAPTAAVDTNTTQIATTAMVLGQAASATPLIDGTAAVGTSTRYARGDHVHPTDTTRAPTASPTFTGTSTVATLTATTINAFTLGGTVSGGGNQINNVVIGAATPLAGTFTTFTAVDASVSTASVSKSDNANAYLLSVANANAGASALAGASFSTSAGALTFQQNGTNKSYGASANGDGMVRGTAAGFVIMSDNAAGTIKFAAGGSAETARFSASGGLSIGSTSDPGAGLIYTNSASFLMRTKTSLSNGAAAAAGTLTNAPAAGNPTKWLPYDDNGTTRYIPAW